MELRSGHERRNWGPDVPVRPDYLTFGSPDIREPEIEELVATLRSGWIGTGPKASAFEDAFAAYVDVPHAVALSSCSAALHVAMLVIGLEAGEEVILPSLTFAATANAVIHAGGRPVLADVKRDTACLDPADVERRISARTRAIMPVHFAGRSCDMDSLIQLARGHGLRIVEDCAHAVETLHGGHHAGTLGDLGAFSFYVTKNVVTCEGGMLITSDAEWAQRARTLALHGLSADAWQRFSDEGHRHYQVVESGFKYNMTDLQASLGLHQLARVEANLSRRNEVWSRYDEAVADLPAVAPASVTAGNRHARHLYTLMLDLDRLAVDRDTIGLALHRQGIGTGIHYLALHRHDFYRRTYGYSALEFPNSEWISERTLSLPLSTKLTDRDVDDVIFALRNTLLHFSR